MNDDNPSTDAKTITVRFTQHQLELIERLRQEGGFGETAEKVVIHVVRAVVEEKAGNAL